MAEETKKPKKSENEDEVKAKSFVLNKETVMLGASIIIPVLGISFVIFSILFGKKNIDETEQSAIRENVLEIQDVDGVLSGATYSLEPFIINLHSGSGVLYVGISLEFYDFEIPADINTRTASIRDFIITRASNFHLKELEKNGPEKLKKALLDDINLRLPNDNPVTNVYIENFLIR